MIIALLSFFGLILAIVVMIISSVVASRIETINIQGQVYILLNSVNTEMAYNNAVISSVFTGIIILIFIIAMIIDIIYENKQENNQNAMSQLQTNQQSNREC
jgi:uncharacterized protein HemY